MQQTQSLISENELLALAKKVVARYSHTIPSSEREDVVMSLIENYLKQEDKITSRFNNQSKASTYIIAILNRICCGVIRKELKHWQNANEDHFAYLNEGGQALDSAKDLLIRDEVNYLKKVLCLLDQPEKTIVFIAFYNRFTAKLRLVKQYDKAYKTNNTFTLLSHEESLKKGQIFERLAIVTNIVEKMNIKADAVRMWLNKEIKLITNRLNGPFQRANYDKDSFHILFEYYYESK